MTKLAKPIQMALLAVAFLVIEFLCIYLYSWLWLVEGHPDYMNQSLVTTLAWVAIITALISPAVLVYVAVCLTKK
jgi:hypothetical protein